MTTQEGKGKEHKIDLDTSDTNIAALKDTLTLAAIDYRNHFRSLEKQKRIEYGRPISNTQQVEDAKYRLLHAADTYVDIRCKRFLEDVFGSKKK